MRFNNTPAPLTLRANRLRDDAARNCAARLAERSGPGARRGRSRPTRLIVDEGYPLRGAGLDQGWFVVQDEASQLVALLAGERPVGARARHLRVARRQDHGARGGDGRRAACSSPATCATGGSSCCGERWRRPARRTCAIVQADLLKPLPFASTVRLRRSSTRRAPAWARCAAIPTSAGGGAKAISPAFAAAELTMLQHAADGVAPGGRLVYATCSSEPEENEGVADAFLATTPAFAPVDARAARTRCSPER